jgi:hypothetical protein
MQSMAGTCVAMLIHLYKSSKDMGLRTLPIEVRREMEFSIGEVQRRKAGKR